MLLANSYVTDSIKRASLITCLFVCTIIQLSAQSHPNWSLDRDLHIAYNHSLKLELGTSRSLLEKYQGTSSYGKVYLEHLNDAIEVFINGDQIVYDQFINQTNQRIADIKDAAESPYKWHYLSSLKLHKTFIQLKFGEELSAAWNFRQAFNWAEDNQENYPGFDLDSKNLGLMHIIIGSTPEKYRWLLNFFGFRGSIKQGIYEISNFSKTNAEFSFESTIILAFIYSYLLQDSETGLEMLDEYPNDPSDHTLLSFARSSLLIKASRGEEALNVLNSLNLNNKLPFPFLEYQKANILQQRGDYEGSTSSFQQFLIQFNGNNYVKDAYYKIGINYWLSNNYAEAEEYFSAARNTGLKITEADKNAASMLSTPLPNKEIFKLRLATDGGFYKEAHALVEEIKEKSFEKQKDSVEFIYRKARLKHKYGDVNASIPMYEETIQRAGNERWYFAPNSALQLGYIYRDMGMLDQAKLYFEKAVSYKGHPYKNSIDNKAKAALEALE